uniref:Uncharacterized protein n=1 Tax=Panagrolaimus davidi TaxID=227884 RepID=A0A914QIP7_9BILA
MLKLPLLISNDPTCSSELSEDIYELHLSAEIREGHDYFNIYVDGILREKLDKSMIYQRYFPRELNVTLEFISTSDLPVKNGDRGWVLKLKNQKSPPIDSVTLDESMPLYTVDILSINEFDIISVCAPETDELELIIASDKTLLQNYVLFDETDYIGK